MQEFIKMIEDVEIEALGDHWREKIDNVINEYINTARNLNKPDTATSRVMELIGIAPVNIEEIHLAYLSMHGMGTISREYIRLVVSKLHKSGHIKRHSRGKYIRV